MRLSNYITVYISNKYHSVEMIVVYCIFMEPITLLCKPLSVNEAWRGRKIKTEKYEDFENDVFYLLKEQAQKFADMAASVPPGPIEVIYCFYLRNHKKADYDNCIKAFQDLLVNNGLIHDDRLIYHADIYKIPSDVDKIQFIIRPYEIQYACPYL